jgi:type IX secretion system PorP/SprF family membrane protein
MLILGTVGISYAQVDPMFLQQTNNRGLLNPAVTGKGGDVSASLTIREQWIGFPGPSTKALYANGFVSQLRSGFGVTWINDAFGPQQTNNIKLNYAYFVPFEDAAFLALGMKMGVMSNIYDETDFFAHDSDDATITGIKRSKVVPDFDVGLEFNTRQFEIGASVTHVTYMTPDQNTLRPMRNIYAYSRVKVPMNRYWDFIPGITWHNTIKFNTDELNVGFRYENNLCVNLIYRNPMSAGLAVGINIQKVFRVAYSYDYGFDNLSQYNSGSHEVTLSYNIPMNTTYVANKLRFFKWKMF